MVARNMARLTAYWKISKASRLSGKRQAMKGHR
jgi:hypothetical protein